MKPEEHVYGSHCCHASLNQIDKVEEKRSFGWIHYYYNRCNNCGGLADSTLIRLADSEGKEILPGDMIECPEESVDSAWRYHAVFERDGQIEIRDLGHNNVGMYNLQGKFINIGPYWKHLDKLSDEDLEYYWNTNRADAEARNQRGE